MSRLPESFLQQRASRDASWNRVAQDVNALKASLDERGLARRAFDRTLLVAQDAAHGARMVASENRKATAAAAIAAGVLICRKPLLRGVSRLFRRRPASINAAETTIAAPTSDEA